MKPTVGRIVEYILKDRYGQLQVRPAIIVRVWSDECVQLQVYTDGTNDGTEYASGIFWATSVLRSEEKKERTWDWMEYQKGQAKKTEDVINAIKAMKDEPAVFTIPLDARAITNGE